MSKMIDAAMAQAVRLEARSTTLAIQDAGVTPRSTRPISRV
jgi:hypothetical protein